MKITVGIELKCYAVIFAYRTDYSIILDLDIEAKNKKEVT
jgi:hypothetical protein